MGKNKLARWNELGSFPNVIQPSIIDVVETSGTENITDTRFPSGNIKVKDHPVKGNWNNTIFCNSNPLVLELGCGRGEYTIGLSRKYPEKNFVGVDIKGARLWRGAKTSNQENLKNAAFLRTRIEFISSFFAENEVNEIWITFPDPHPGARNSNKRLTSPWYLNSYKHFLREDSIIHLKTDNTELFSYTEKIVRKNDLKLLHCTSDLYSQKDLDDILSIKTHYEQIFLRTGMKICYLSFIMKKHDNISD
ncbi:MAG TPA: tRNA (guanosine(46)-N7)-methyltransferase TrmB [Bacteroidales bacterium]|nr:tRNA (guanosine(46)-N7)-methyltransferase TrmB [Bacteroidales bacterium]